jgi:hypothetical protein
MTVVSLGQNPVIALNQASECARCRVRLGTPRQTSDTTAARLPTPDGRTHRALVATRSPRGARRTSKPLFVNPWFSGCLWARRAEPLAEPEVDVLGLVLGSGVTYPKSRLFRMLSRSRWISSRA